MAMEQSIGFSDASTINVRGFDLCDDLLGKVTVTDLAWLMIANRMPTRQERRLLDSILVAVADHGITPSAVATRLTLTGAPDSLQGAIAAGLLGVGSVLVGPMEECAAMLREIGALRPDQRSARCRQIVAEAVRDKRKLPGFGHPVHIEADPRVERLLSIAAEEDVPGVHVALLHELHRQLIQHLGGRHLPVNAAGAIAAILADLGAGPGSARGLAVIGRTVGLLGHVLDELRHPNGIELWKLCDESIPYRAL